MKKTFALILTAALLINMCLFQTVWGDKCQFVTNSFYEDNILLAKDGRGNQVGANWNGNYGGTTKNDLIVMPAGKYAQLAGDARFAMAGTVEYDIDVIPTAADNADTVFVRLLNKSGATSAMSGNFRDVAIICFTNKGILQVNGAWNGTAINHGTYSPNVRYSFKVILDWVNNCYNVTLVSGEIDGISVKNKNLGGAYFADNVFAFTGFLIYNYSKVAYYVDNVKVMPLPADELTCSQVTNGLADAGTTDFDINLNQYADLSQGAPVIKKKAAGEADFSVLNAESDYTLTWGVESAEGLTGNFARISPWKAKPHVALNTPSAIGDEYEFDFSAMKDTYGRTIGKKLAFSISGVSSNASIEGFEGYEFGIDDAAGTITGVVKGELAANILSAAVVNPKASLTFLSADETDITDSADKTYIFGGEKIKVTAEDGKTVKVYTLSVQNDIFSHNFNDGTDNRGYSSDRGSYPNNIFNKVFSASLPNSQGRVAVPENDENAAYVTSGTVGTKTDRSLLFSAVNADIGKSNNRTYFTPNIDIGSVTENTKKYAFNISVRPAEKNANTSVSIIGGNRNSSNSLSRVEFKPDGTISVICPGLPDYNAGKFAHGMWYTVSMTVDMAAKRGSVFVNGEAVRSDYDLTAAFDGWYGSANAEDTTMISFCMSQQLVSGTGITAHSYFDNLSFYEVASPVTMLPNDFDFVPEINGLKINNPEGTVTVTENDLPLTVDNIYDALSNIPDDFTVSFYDSAEEMEFSGDFDDWISTRNDPVRIILQNGDFVKEYEIRIPEYEFVGGNGGTAIANGENSFTLPSYRSEGTFVLAVYKNGQLTAFKTAPSDGKSRTLSYTIAENEDAGSYTMKAFVFEGTDNIRPLSEAITIK